MQTEQIYFIKVINTTNPFSNNFGCYVGCYVYITCGGYGKTFGYTKTIIKAGIFKSKSDALEAIEKYEADSVSYEVIEFKKI